MQKLLYILFCITLISCNSKKEEIEEEVIEIKKEIDLGISEEEIYAVINTHLEREKTHYKTHNKELNTNFISFSFLIDNDFLNYYGVPNLIENDSLFTDEDREFIKLQIKKTETFDLNQKYFSDFTVIPKDTILNLLSKSQNKNYGKIILDKYEIMNWITLPLFSKNKGLAIINYEYLCGSLCAESRTSVYKKENGKWIWLKDISYAVS